MKGKTTQRFEREIKREAKVLEYSFQFCPWLKELINNYEIDNTAFHDYKVLFNNGNVGLVEIQITHYGESKKEGFRKYGDVRLDLISSFDPNQECCHSFKAGSNRWKALKGREELKQFTNICTVRKWGKLVTCGDAYSDYAICEMFTCVNDLKLIYYS